MKIEDLDLKLDGTEVTISDEKDLYVVVFSKVESPVCWEAEDCFAATGSDGMLIIDGSSKDPEYIENTGERHENTQIRMAVQNLRTRVFRVVQFSGNIFEKHFGSQRRRSGIIVDHPMLNGLICRRVIKDRQPQNLWSVYRPFNGAHCFGDWPTDIETFSKKYLGVTYSFPETLLDVGHLDASSMLWTEAEIFSSSLILYS